jgi:hypothetical protein
LQEDGEAVTIEAVQDFLGEGSPNAIFKHLAAWRATAWHPNSKNCAASSKSRRRSAASCAPS